MTKPSTFFNENIQLLGGVKNLARTDAEKFNLYAGLESLSIVVEGLQTRLTTLDDQLSDIQRKLRQLSV